MVLTISTNTSAISVQKNLNKASEAANSSLSKLSSGSRVPTAKDDAASLAIGSRVEAEIAGLKQASINASQATSLLQIADGAYGEINDILVRQSTLAIQSSSGQLSDSERAIIDSEFQQLNSEVDRIADDTEFNGNQLLKGGAKVISTDELSTGGLASKGLSVSYDTNTANGTDAFSVAYDQASQTLKLTNGNTGEVIEKDITAALTAATGDATTATDLSAGEEVTIEFADAGVSITLNDDFDRSVGFGVSATATGTVDLGTTANFDVKSGDFTDLLASTAFDADTGKLTLDSATGTLTANNLVINVDNAVGAISNDAVLTIKNAAGTDTLLELQLGTVVAGGGTDTIELDLGAIFDTSNSTSAQANFSFKVGTGSQAQDSIGLSIDSVTTTALGTNAANVATQTAADAAIGTVKSAIDQLQGSRAEIGASLSRLDFASSNLSVAIENQSAAKSGLLDVDVASETTEYAAKQVVVQAGVSLLAQANQQPNNLLKLIG